LFSYSTPSPRRSFSGITTPTPGEIGRRHITTTLRSKLLPKEWMPSGDPEEEDGLDMILVVMMIPAGSTVDDNYEDEDEGKGVGGLIMSEIYQL